MKKKLIISNLVYGSTYAYLFLEHHLKSLLDPTNIPAIKDKYDIEYLIFTDDDTMKQIGGTDRIKELHETVKLSWVPIDFADIKNKFEARYGALLMMFHNSVKRALAQDAYLSSIVADLVYAKHALPRMMEKMESGHGAVFMLPLRAAAEPLMEKLKTVNGALEDKDLFAMGYECLHPLWVACHWKSEQFTKLPFTLLWNSGTGLKAHSFSITPIVFQPKEEMLKSRGMIDGDIPALCDNPFWCQDWTDAPVIGVEPLFCYYPTFKNKKSSSKDLKEFMKVLHPTQIPFLAKPLYYPDRETVMKGEPINGVGSFVKNILSTFRPLTAETPTP